MESWSDYENGLTWGQIIQLPARHWLLPAGETPTPGTWADYTPAESVGSGDLQRVTQSIAEHLLEHASTTPLRRSVSTIDRPITRHMLPPMATRATNIVGRDLTTRDLAQMSPNDLMTLRNAGRLTCIEIIAAILQVAVRLERIDPSRAQSLPELQTVWTWDSVSTDEMRLEDKALEVEAPQTRDPRHECVLEDLLTVARWQMIRGHGPARLLAALSDDPVPEEVAVAQERLRSLTSAALVDADEAPDATSSLDAYLSLLDERELLILKNRFFAEEPDTLDVLGKRMGVTRERVRQLESKVVARLREATEFGGPTGDFLAVLRAEIQSVVPLERLTQRHPNLLSEVRSVNRPLWLALDRIDDAFEVVDGWAAAPTVFDAASRTQQALEDLDNRHGLVRLAALGERLGHTMSTEELAAWTEYCGYVVMEEHVLVRKAIPDRVVAILALENRPMSSAELFARITDRSATSIKNAMADDDRVHRVDRDTWALSEWGHESYTSIRDMIGRHLDRQGGTARLSELLDALTDRFQVSANSVTAYASSPPFQVVDGWVSRSTDDTDRPKAPGQTRRLYRSDGEWKFRIMVTDDHLRGSGFPVPRGVADLVGCKRGESVVLESPGNVVSIRWTGMQSTCGSIRSLLDDIGAQKGDVVFLVLDPWSRRARVELVPSVGEAAPEDRVRLLMGLKRTAGERDGLWRDLAQALDLPEGSDSASIAHALRDRGERDLYEEVIQLLPTFAAPSADERALPAEPAPVNDELWDLLGLSSTNG